MYKFEKLPRGIQTAIVNRYTLTNGDLEETVKLITELGLKRNWLTPAEFDGVTAAVISVLIIRHQIAADTAGEYIIDYVKYKLDAYKRGDKGARGDIVEPIVRCLKTHVFQARHFHVNSAMQSDINSKDGRIEVGHNGKALVNGVYTNGQFNCDWFVYGILTDADFDDLLARYSSGDIVKASREIIGEKLHVFTPEQAATMLAISYTESTDRDAHWRIRPEVSKTKEALHQVPTLNEWLEGLRG